MSKSFLTNQQLAQPGYHQLTVGEERDLCKAIKADLHQFGQLIELFYRRLYQHSYLHLDDEQAAAEICRVVFIRALDGFEAYTFSVERPLSKWLYEIFRDVMLEKLPDPEAESDALSAAPVVHTHSLENRDVKRLAIDAYLRSLKFNERELLILRSYEQLEWQSIADLLPGDADQARQTYDRLIASFARDIQVALDRIVISHPAFVA